MKVVLLQVQGVVSATTLLAHIMFSILSMLTSGIARFYLSRKEIN